ncbi:putative mg2+ transporter protein [Botrytis fragariae]|uniref:Putative mg2+ transporter protein n=1 Tax=Botrytis fragariae TaxID=1964551 RepID=A0A8H6AI75_9HELO|nr:putative mg2+ transporter protein [Botrytis fragariae]KAF5867786.1 putative mg2+ transporter protein [Botrytis fragariae]
MARRLPDDGSLYERLRGPRRAETLPVRFDENPTQIPEIGVRRRGGEQRHAAEPSSSHNIIDNENDYHDFYNDQRTIRPPSRFVSPSPPPPDITESRPRSPSTASVNHRREQATSYYSSAPSPALFHEGASDRLYLKRVAAREQTYSTRSRERSRSRFRSSTRYRYSGSQSSSHERVPNLSSYDGRYGVPETKAAETYIESFDHESEAYSFRLSRLSKHALESEMTDDLNSASSERGVPSLSLRKHTSLTMQRPKIDKIIQSHYIGDGIMGGIHSVDFTIALGQAGSTVKLPAPLFSWVQFEDSTMDFDSFHSGILNLDGLKEGERLGISRLLDLVKRRYHKTLQVSSRTKVGHIIPRLLQESLRDETPPTTFKPRKLTWLCLPYFSLQKYTSSNVKSSSHPPRTLLQTRQSMTPKERDLKQAVCHLPDTPAGSCFHIGQAWFLILDDSSIISCAGSSTAQMTKDSISMAPFRNDNADSPMYTLLVSDSGSTLWSLPIGECTTWIDFVKHFFEIWPLKFEFAYDGHVITPKDWPRIFKRAKSSKVCLHFRLSSKSKRTPAGVLIVPSDSIGGFGKGNQNPEKDGASHQPDMETLQENFDTKASDSKSVDASKAAEMPYPDEFHVFSWMNTQIDKSISPNLTRSSAARNVAIVNETLLHDDLQEINDFLLQKTNINERFAYKASPRHTRKQFYDILFKVESKIQTDQSLQATYELQVELANAAEVLFRFFLSPQDLGHTTEEFWGPLYEIIVAMLPYGLIQSDGSPENDDLNSVPQRFSDRAWIVDTRDVKQIIDWMALIGKRIEVFKELLSEVPILKRCEIGISEKLPRAWLHILMALAFTKDMASSWYTHMNLCLDLMNEGMKETLQTLSKYQLSDYVVFAPFDLASLITFQLSQDLTGSCPDICTTYVDYMISLESDIDADPINREHQGRITDLKQEVSVILETLETQREVIQNALHAQSRSNFQNSRLNRVVPEHKYEYKLPTFVQPRTTNYRNHERSVYHGDNYGDLEIMTTGPAINQSAGDNTRGVQGLLFRESLALIDERIEVFRDINGRAMYLEDWNLRSIDTNKDRQETAVYAFTIVTIIFLPLSTVASILGMNTNDVRNMEVTQWLFWIIAIPITIIIIVLVLIWSDEWYNFWAGFKNLWGKKTKQRRVRLPDEYSRPETKSGFGFAPTARVSGIYPGHYPPPPGPLLRSRKLRTMFDDVPLPY